MRRWNGWGDENVRVEIPQGALEYLRELIGPGDPPPEASFESVTNAVPASRLPQHPLVDVSPATRVLHARGQSLPDWFALRFGRLGRIPDGVAFPESSEDVRDLLEFARACDARLIPYGGGTSVAGHLDVPDGEDPVLTVSLARMRGLLNLDPVARLTRQRIPDEQLVVAHAIEVAGVQQRDAGLERRMDGGDALGAVGGAVHARHAHAAKTDGGALRARLTQLKLLHDVLSRCAARKALALKYRSISSVR